MSSQCSSTISQHLSVVINGTFHVLILFTFLTVLFFLLIAPLETDAFEGQIKDQVGNSMDGITQNLSPSNKDRITSMIYSDAGDGQTGIDAAISHYSTPSEIIIEHNKWVLLTAIEIISGLIICLILVVGVLSYSCGKCTGVFEIIKENLITFAFIGIVEYLFFTRIAFKYVPAPPSTMVTTIIDTFKANFA